MFEGKKFLVTGGTGSLGKAVTKKLLKTDVDTIRIYSRDELKQIEMESELDDHRVRFLIGDIREKERLTMALEDIDVVIHAAALKHVPIAEYNAFEAVKTNVYGSQNLIEACLARNVQVALAAGTDKAVSPLNTYGATKLLMERLFTSANYYKGGHKTKFLCVRYGNVLGSRGSIVPKLIHQIQNGKKLTITDPEMTRFNISMDESSNLIFRALEYGTGGEIFIPKLKAYRLEDVKNALLELLNAKNETEIISVRPGEKFHEILINKDELRNTYETDKDYIIFEKDIQQHNLSPSLNEMKTELVDQYSSDNVELLDKEQIKKILVKENLLPI